MIRHGALGDFFQAFPVFETLRRAFPTAHLTLLTASTHAELAKRAPWFDEVLTDDRPSLTDWRHALKMRRLLRCFERVYDFQNSGRTRNYLRLSRLGKHVPDWCSAHPGARWQHDTPARKHMHTLLRQEEQLRCAGLIPQPRRVPDWLREEGPKLVTPYVVLVPGAAVHRPAKRWPLAHFAALMPWLHLAGLEIVVAGAPHETILGAELAQEAQRQGIPLQDMTGKTSLPELAGLMACATLAIGNDTGPLHIAASMDTPCLTLFSQESDPRRTAPLSVTPGRSQVLAVEDLKTLSPQAVKERLIQWRPDLFTALTASGSTSLTG